MRILRNILLLILPLAIFVNLYRYIVVGQIGDSFEYRGFHFFFEYFSTFNGLKHTIDTLNLIKENVRCQYSELMMMKFKKDWAFISQSSEEDFYGEFYNRLGKAKEMFGF